jgi:DNA-binding transcriptional MerR regulator
MVAEIHSGYSTAEVAKEIDVAKKTLLRWLGSGELPEPDFVKVGHVSYRMWSEADLERAKRYRESHYRQKRS